MCIWWSLGQCWRGRNETAREPFTLFPNSLPGSFFSSYPGNEVRLTPVLILCPHRVTRYARASACTGQECRYHTRLPNNSTFLFFAPLRHFLRCISLKRRHLYYDRTLGVLRSKHLPLGGNLLFSNILKVLQGEPGKQQYEK